MEDFALWTTEDKFRSRMKEFDEYTYPLQLGEENWLILQPQLFESQLAFEGLLDTTLIVSQQAANIGALITIHWTKRKQAWAGEDGVKVSIRQTEPLPQSLNDQLTESQQKEVKVFLLERVEAFQDDILHSFRMVEDPFGSKKPVIIPPDSRAAKNVKRLMDLLELEDFGVIRAYEIPLSISEVDAVWRGVLDQQLPSSLSATDLSRSDSYIVFHLRSEVYQFGEIQLQKRGKDNTEMRLTRPGAEYHDQGLVVVESFQRVILKAFFRSLKCNLEIAYPAKASSAESGQQTARAPAEGHGGQKRVVLQTGKPGRNPDLRYDEAFQRMGKGESEEDTFKWFCDQEGVSCPDKTLRDSFKAAIKRRQNKA